MTPPSGSPAASPDMPVIGWDLGGVHVKAALVRDRPRGRRGPGALPPLARAARPRRDPGAAARLGAGHGRPRRHHDGGTHRLLRRPHRRRAADLRLGRGASHAAGCGSMAAVPASSPPKPPPAHAADIASANWHATAALIGRHVADGLLVDIGSTTADLIPIVGGRAGGGRLQRRRAPGDGGTRLYRRGALASRGAGRPRPVPGPAHRADGRDLRHHRRHPPHPRRPAGGRRPAAQRRPQGQVDPRERDPPRPHRRARPRRGQRRRVARPGGPFRGRPAPAAARCGRPGAVAPGPCPAERPWWCAAPAASWPSAWPRASAGRPSPSPTSSPATSPRPGPTGPPPAAPPSPWRCSADTESWPPILARSESWREPRA